MKFNSSPSNGSGGNNFLKLKDGESATLILQGDIYEFYAVWQESRYVHVPAGTPKASFKFRVNAITLENGAFVAKILEGGANLYRDLKELNVEYDLETTKIKMTRSGSGTETRYTVMPLAKQPLSKEQLKQIVAVELQDLRHKDVAVDVVPADTDPDELIPF